MDCLIITALSVNTRIGIHAWEQRISQRLLINITIPADFSACNDDIINTLDYDKLCQQVTSYVESTSFNLIETVADSVAVLIKTTFNLSQIEVSVSKPHAVKNASDIRVMVTR